MSNNLYTKSWDEIKEKLRNKYLLLIDVDFLFAEGKQEVMWDKLAKKIGKTRQELNTIITGL